MFGLGVLEMETGRNAAVLEHEHRLDQTGHACGGFQMAEIRFHRADDQRRFVRTACAQRLRERVGLDRIADRRARAVRLDETDPRRSDARVRACVAHQPRLRLRAGKRNAIRMAVLIQSPCR